jgi:hypothetical protein
MKCIENDNSRTRTSPQHKALTDDHSVSQNANHDKDPIRCDLPAHGFSECPAPRALLHNTQCGRMLPIYRRVVSYGSGKTIAGE